MGFYWVVTGCFLGFEGYSRPDTYEGYLGSKVTTTTTLCVFNLGVFGARPDLHRKIPTFSQYISDNVYGLSHQAHIVM